MWWSARHSDVEADPTDKTREEKLNMRIDVETIDVDWRSGALGSSGSGSSLSSEPPPSPGGPICCDAGAAPIDAAPAAGAARDAYVGAIVEPRSIDDFALLNVLGVTAFGKVVLARGARDELYAIKSLRKAELARTGQLGRILRERRVLEQVDEAHPFITRLHFSFESDATIYFGLDYCGGGDLFALLSKSRRFSEHMMRFYACELILAFEFLHAKKIVYRDTKPENVLLDAEGHVRLCDFGYARDGVGAATSGASTMCGTPEYMAPEVITEVGHGTAVDWWGLGMICYEMVAGLPPWFQPRNRDRQLLFGRIQFAPLAMPAVITPICAAMLQRLLERDPAKRLGAGAGGAADVREDPFFRPVDWAAAARGAIEPPVRPKGAPPAVVVDAPAPSPGRSSSPFIACMASPAEPDVPVGEVTPVEEDSSIFGSFFSSNSTCG